MSRRTVQVTISWPISLILTFIFVTLKLVGEITWSWWWVFAPIWIPIALVLFGLLIFVIYVTRDKWKNWFR